MEEYLTVDELSARIKFSKQSLYNLIHKGILVLGKHYLKPTPRRSSSNGQKSRYGWGKHSYRQNKHILKTLRSQPPPVTFTIHLRINL